MTLRLADRWLWDFWFAHDGDDVHVFFLQAPRALGDPELRHHHATIGHAVSRDLRDWRVLPDALGPGAQGAFDDLAAWTGSIVEHDGRWHLLYTGVTRAEGAAAQRIGHASSGDLLRWERHGMVLEPDPRWYEWPAWRDPWVEAGEDGFEMLLTARARTGPEDGRGVIGRARSADLRVWEALPPVSDPGAFLHLEVPQRVQLGGAWRILFCVTAEDHAAARLAQPGAPAVGHPLPDRRGARRALPPRPRGVPGRRPGGPAVRRARGGAPRRVVVHGLARARPRGGVPRRARRPDPRGGGRGRRPAAQ